MGTNASPLVETLAHLRWLCRPLGTNPAALASAVYSRVNEQGARELVVAAETGEEGVACVDDAARLAVLLNTVLRTASPHQSNGLAAWRIGLLRFVRMMWCPDLGFHNFVLQWDGTINTVGPTSRAGGGWWTARASRALAFDSSDLGPSQDELRRLLVRMLQARSTPEEQAAIVWSLFDLSTASGTSAEPVVEEWCGDMLGGSDAAALAATTTPDGSLQLWGHSQELVLALVAHRRTETAWMERARSSCHESLRPIVASSFRHLDSVCPYDVSSVVRTLAVVGTACGDQELIAAAHLAFEWFSGRNRARVPMISPIDGRTSDGLDGMIVSRNSGAESNIEACSAWCTLRWVPGEQVP